MTNQEILEKAIQKAIDGGYTNVPKFVGITIEQYAEDLLTNDNKPYDIIFNHDFAKALWGEPKEVDFGKRDSGGMKIFGVPKTIGWQYHLQQMVIAEDPIKYLGEHLD